MSKRIKRLEEIAKKDSSLLFKVEAVIRDTKDMEDSLLEGIGGAIASLAGLSVPAFITNTTTKYTPDLILAMILGYVVFFQGAVHSVVNFSDAYEKNLVINRKEKHLLSLIKE